MQDKESDSYWSIMKGRSVGGQFDGVTLKQLPVTRKVLWKEWVTLHPETLVLSVNGREHVDSNPYESYLTSEERFRQSAAVDDRLEAKQAVFVFRLSGRSFAVPFPSLEGGRVFQIEDAGIFLYREKGSSVHQSTAGFLTEKGHFQNVHGKWLHTESGKSFDVDSQTFPPEAEGVEPLNGFDTFWYTWSPFHPDSEILQ